MQTEHIAAGFYSQLLGANSLSEAANALGHTLLTAGFGAALITKLSADHQALVSLAHPGLPHRIPRRVRLPLAPNTLSRATLENGPRILAAGDVLRSPGDPWWRLLDLPPVPIWAEIPLVHKPNIFGLVFLLPKTVKFQNIGAVYAQAASYLHQFELYSERQLKIQDAAERADAEASLLILDRALSDALSETYRHQQPRLDAIFQLIADTVIEITGALACDISLETNGIYSPIAQAGQLANIGQTADINNSLADDSISLRAVRQRELVIEIGKRTDSVYKAMLGSLKGSRNSNLLQSFRSWGAIPVSVGGTYPGVISVASPDWDFFVPWRKHVLHSFSEKTALVLTVEDLVRFVDKKMSQQQEKIRDLSLTLTQSATRAGFAEAARTVVHNLANLIQPIGTDLQKIQKATGKGRTLPSGLMEGMETRLVRIEEVLDFYQRLRSGKDERRPHSVKLLIREAVEFCRYSAERYSVQIKLNLSGDDARIVCSDAELLQAFLNIITNAIEAMSEVRNSARRLTIRMSLAPQGVVLKFTDTGIGIADQDRGRVWEPDFTTKLEKGGTGLGLPHVKRVVEACGGSVTVQSRFGRGATVTVTLPGQTEIIV